MTDWTDERIAELTRRWAAGESAGEIAVAMNCGFTRNSIIGKVKRMGLPARATVVHRKVGGNRNIVDWAERRRVILDVQANGGTSGDAALRLGVAYDTIRKDAQRLGIPFGKAYTAAKGERKRVSTPRAPRPPRAARPAPVARVAAPVPDDAIDLLHVKDASAFSGGRCKWPVNESATAGGHLFCGHATSEKAVYCNTHNALAYVPVPGREQIYASRR